MTANRSLYEKDFFGWCNDQSEELIAGRIHNLDLENLAEEIRSLGNRERWELINNLAVLFTHLLKWEFQPGYRTASWKHTIMEHTERIGDLLEENPSLKSQMKACSDKAYKYARRMATKETMLPIETFPLERNISIKDVATIMTDKDQHLQMMQRMLEKGEQ
jgi:hypothetical protein